MFSVWEEASSGWQAGSGTAPRANEPSAQPRPHLSLVHFTAGAGSPTELQGSRTSFIQGVVTVPPNEIILAGAAEEKRGGRGKMGKLSRLPACLPASTSSSSLPPRPNLFQQAQW